MAYNDLTIDAASSYAAEPDVHYETLAALLVFSVLFHRQLVFLDAHLINNPGMRRIARDRPEIIECLRLTSVQVALRSGYDDLAGLMEAQAARKAYSPFFERLDDRYLKEDMAPLLALARNVSPSHRYDVREQGRKFTSLSLHNFKRCAPNFKGAEDYATFMQLLAELRASDAAAQLNQMDFRWYDEGSRLHSRLRDRGLLEWCELHRELIYDLQVHAYRMTSSSVLDVRSIIDRKADEIERLMAPDVVLRESRTVLENRYFYARNLSKLTPEILAQILATSEALAFFDMRDSRFGAFSYEAQERAARAYVRVIDRILTQHAAKLGLTPGNDSAITMLTRTSEGFFAAAKAFEGAWTKVEQWAEVSMSLDLGKAISLMLNVEVGFEVLKDALSHGAKVAPPLAHAVRMKSAAFAVENLERMEDRLGQAIRGNVERVTGNTVQL